MFPVTFTLAKSTHHLAAGERLQRPTALAFRDTPAEELRALSESIRCGLPWRAAVETRYAETQPWLSRIVLAPERTAFFDQLVPATPGLAVDIGCGWGQTARPLARRGWSVAALEPGVERLDFVHASACQEGLDTAMCFIAADYLETDFVSRFDLALCIGVFEWIGAFQEQDDPLARQREFLRKVRRELSPGGSLILGIENRLGLKYLLGCADDHLGVPGIAFLPAALAARRWRERTQHTLRSFTYTDAELRALLREAGFTAIDFFAALPDYKVPGAIVPLSDHGAAFNAGMLSGALFAPEHNGYDGTALSTEQQENLQGTYASLAMQGIAHHFAPSFFVRAR